MQKTINLYNLITPDVGGHCSFNKIELACDLIKKNNLKTIVEIGVYKGSFLLPVSAYGNCKTYGIDPYKSYSQDSVPTTHILHKQITNLTHNQNRFDQLYKNNIKMIIDHNLDCDMIRLPSSLAHEIFKDNSIDLLHIDGCHDYSFAYDDLQNYYCKVKPDGYIIMDDMEWPTVRKAFNDFFINNPTFVKENIFENTKPNWLCIKKIK